VAAILPPDTATPKDPDMRARSLSLPSLPYRALGALALATVMALVSPIASAGVENPGDTPTVHAVRMNVDLLHRVIAINKEREALDQDSMLFMRTKDNHVPKTIDELVAEVHSNPQLEALIARHKLSPRQYLLAAMAFADAGLGVTMLEAGETETVRKQNISAQHMAFIKAHWDEIGQLDD
jgi:hypothetical protein